MKRNEGRIPPECEIRDDAGNVTDWRNVHVRCFGGYDSRKAGHAPWPASTGRAQTTNWKISRPPFGFEIREFEIA